MGSSRRRTALAWLLSLTLHGALLLWAVQRGAPSAPVRASTDGPVEIEWIEVEVAEAPPTLEAHRDVARSAVRQPVTPRPPPAEPTPKPTAQPRTADAKPVTPPPPDGATADAPRPLEPVAESESAPRGDEPDAPPASAPNGSEEALALDGDGAERGREASAGKDSPEIAAQGPGLIPVIPGVGGSRANVFESQSRGRTIRNGEGEAPDAEALAEVNAEKARRKVQGFAIDALAAARVRGGIVDGYFGDMKKALQRTTENPPKFTEGATFVHDLLEAWSAGGSQYALTGNPYGEGKMAEGSAVRDANDPLQQRMNARIGGGGSALDGDPESDFLNKQQAAARLREFADGRFGKGIIALVEIRQQRDGALEGVALVQSSGNRLFDKHVLTTAPLAIARLEAAPGQGQGIHTDGIRTLWAFEGRIVFKRKVKPEELGVKEWAGIAGQQALSALTNGWVPGSTGTFDETTGEMEIVDLTNPRFTCTPRLLRIY